MLCAESSPRGAVLEVFYTKSRRQHKRYFLSHLGEVHADDERLAGSMRGRGATIRDLTDVLLRRLGKGEIFLPASERTTGYSDEEEEGGGGVMDANAGDEHGNGDWDPYIKHGDSEHEYSSISPKEAGPNSADSLVTSSTDIGIPSDTETNAAYSNPTRRVTRSQRPSHDSIPESPPTTATSSLSSRRTSQGNPSTQNKRARTESVPDTEEPNDGRRKSQRIKEKSGALAEPTETTNPSPDLFDILRRMFDRAGTTSVGLASTNDDVSVSAPQIGVKPGSLSDYLLRKAEARKAGKEQPKVPLFSTTTVSTTPADLKIRIPSPIKSVKDVSTKIHGHSPDHLYKTTTSVNPSAKVSKEMPSSNKLATQVSADGTIRVFPPIPTNSVNETLTSANAHTLTSHSVHGSKAKANQAAPITKICTSNDTLPYKSTTAKTLASTNPHSRPTVNESISDTEIVSGNDILKVPVDNPLNFFERVSSGGVSICRCKVPAPHIVNYRKCGKRDWQSSVSWWTSTLATQVVKANTQSKPSVELITRLTCLLCAVVAPQNSVLKTVFTSNPKRSRDLLGHLIDEHGWSNGEDRPKFLTVRFQNAVSYEWPKWSDQNLLLEEVRRRLRDKEISFPPASRKPELTSSVAGTSATGAGIAPTVVNAVSEQGKLPASTNGSWVQKPDTNRLSVGMLTERPTLMENDDEGEIHPSKSKHTTISIAPESTAKDLAGLIGRSSNIPKKTESIVGSVTLTPKRKHYQMMGSSGVPEGNNEGGDGNSIDTGKSKKQKTDADEDEDEEFAVRNSIALSNHTLSTAITDYGNAITKDNFLQIDTTTEINVEIPSDEPSPPPKASRKRGRRSSQSTEPQIRSILASSVATGSSTRRSSAPSSMVEVEERNIIGDAEGAAAVGGYRLRRRPSPPKSINGSTVSEGVNDHDEAKGLRDAIKAIYDMSRGSRGEQLDEDDECEVLDVGRDSDPPRADMVPVISLNRRQLEGYNHNGPESINELEMGDYDEASDEEEASVDRPWLSESNMGIHDPNDVLLLENFQLESKIMELQGRLEQEQFERSKSETQMEEMRVSWERRNKALIAKNRQMTDEIERLKTLVKMLEDGGCCMQVIQNGEGRDEEYWGFCAGRKKEDEYKDTIMKMQNDIERLKGLIGKLSFKNYLDGTNAAETLEMLRDGDGTVRGPGRRRKRR